MPRSISVIVTTYNRPDALQLVLQALHMQSRLPDEVIIADDGSTQETRDLIARMQMEVDYPLRHVWQPDEGFRAAQIRNKAAGAAQSDYLIFLDDDCVMRPDFVEKHGLLAEKGWFVAVNRVMLNSRLTCQVLSQQQPIYLWNLKQWFHVYKKGECNRIIRLARLPIGPLRKLAPRCWQKTINPLGLWRQDFESVNGYNEAFVGYGYEDHELVIRLLSSGIRRKSGKFALTVIHLWHPERDRSRLAHNRQLFLATQRLLSIRP